MNVTPMNIKPPLPPDETIHIEDKSVWSQDYSMLAVLISFEAHITFYVLDSDGSLIKEFSVPYNATVKGTPPHLWNSRWTDCS